MDVLGAVAVYLLVLAIVYLLAPELLMSVLLGGVAHRRRGRARHRPHTLHTPPDFADELTPTDATRGCIRKTPSVVVTLQFRHISL